MCEVCKHLPSTAGEAVTMLKKAVPEIVIEWDPHSAADKLCYNFGMPLGVFLLVRVLSSFNTLLTSKTQPTPTRPLSTSYVRSSPPSLSTELRKGKHCELSTTIYTINNTHQAGHRGKLKNR